MRPKQLHAPNWPWTNRILNGYPSVVEREEAPWMPELVSCYDWGDFEYQETLYPGEGLCTRDMKSIFTTAVRMYGYERLYLELKSGNNVFRLIGGEMRRWAEHIFRSADLVDMPIRWMVIGDDIAHNGGLFLPPEMLEWLFDEYIMLAALARRYGASTMYHSDGDVTKAWRGLTLMVASVYLFQTDLVKINNDRIIDHTSKMEWASYPVREAK